jgi:hypothetical protein
MTADSTRDGRIVLEVNRVRLALHVTTAGCRTARRRSILGRDAFAGDLVV